MAKRSKDPFEVFKQATLGKGSSQTSSSSSNENTSKTDNNEGTIKEPDKTSLTYWVEKYYSLLERLVFVCEARLK